ncbi:MAG TPA: hypothetical protein VHK27_02270, partial [Gammaproteobacteria bacterium]|nr:hypothetical protein [Gammaproteobacteria bacterium]
TDRAQRDRWHAGNSRSQHSPSRFEKDDSVKINKHRNGHQDTADSDHPEVQAITSGFRRCYPAEHCRSLRDDSDDPCR